MADQPDNHVQALLRKLDEKLDRASDDLREIKTRVGILEQQYASMSNRIDRIESRLERIERRLELAEARSALAFFRNLPRRLPRDPKFAVYDAIA